MGNYHKWHTVLSSGEVRTLPYRTTYCGPDEHLYGLSPVWTLMQLVTDLLNALSQVTFVCFIATVNSAVHNKTCRLYKSFATNATFRLFLYEFDWPRGQWSICRTSVHRDTAELMASMVLAVQKMASEATVPGTMHLRAGAAVGSLSSTSSQQCRVWQLPAAGIMVTNSSLVETQTEEVY